MPSACARPAAAPGARARIDGTFAASFDGVTIERLVPVGGYAINVSFTDGHTRGIYPWSYLHTLARGPRDTASAARRNGAAPPRTIRMTASDIKTEVIETDLLVIGGGTAGPMAALKAKLKNPDLRSCCWRRPTSSAAAPSPWAWTG